MKRTDADYEIEALTKGVMVLEALEGTKFEPVSIDTIMQRTEFSRDFCTRALRTFRMKGYVIQNERGQWSIGKRLILFAGKISRHGF